MLQLQNISLTLEKQGILKDITFTCEAGKTYVITGEANSGKSMLMKVIGGIIQPTEGYVSFEDTCIEDSSKASFKNHFGFIFQDGVMLSNLSIYDNLLLPIKYLHKEYYPEEVIRKIGMLFNTFHLDIEFLNRRPADLSYSARKLVNFVRGILIDPEIYLINKPLFNLDYIDGKRVIDYLHEMKCNGKTMVITTNNRRLIEHLADEVIILEKGTISVTTSGKDFFCSDNAAVKKYIRHSLGEELERT